MSFDLSGLRVAEHVHGHLGWLCAAALVHPAILLRNRKRRAHLSVVLATALVTVVGTMGAVLYEPYRNVLKQRIFIDARPVGLLFERKEHLAFGAILLAWAGAVAYGAALWAGDDVRMSLRTFAFRAYVASAALATLTAGLGTVVASFRTF